MNFFKKNYLNFLLVICLIVLFIAFYIEYVLGHLPCNLCLIERIPYMVTILIILFTFKFKDYKKKIYLLIFFLFFISTLISLYHLGIEQEIFSESLFCNSNDQGRSLSKEEILKQLKELPISCKNVTFKLFDLSLTTYNILLSLIIFLTSIKMYQNYGKNR